MTKFRRLFLAITLATTLIRPAEAQNNGHIAGTVVAWGTNNRGQSTVPTGLKDVVAVAAGGRHSLALEADGTVVAWGSNDDDFGGYIGQSTVPFGLTGVVAIDAGEYHSLALKADGTVVAWGDNRFGQRRVPEGLTAVVFIAAGSYGSLALKADGTVVAWGGGAVGQSTVPQELTNVVALAAGQDHSLALKADGMVVAWGDNTAGQAAVPTGLTGVVAIAAGFYHNLALKSDGTVVAWGQTYDTPASVPGGLTEVVAIAAGGYNSLALRADGTVVAWGIPEQGTVPVGLSGVVALSAGGWGHSLALVAATNLPTPPAIAFQPFSQVTLGGSNPTFHVVAAGGSLNFQWLKNGRAIEGATSPAYTISDVRTNDAGNYSVVITNHYGSVTSSGAELTVEPIVITQQPQNHRAQWAGTAVNFNVAVSGAAPFSYQWRKDGTIISGATGSVYTISNAQDSHAGNYSVVISNGYGSVTSSNAALTVVPNPVATRTPGTVVAWGEGQQTTPTSGLTDVVSIAIGGGYVTGGGDSYADKCLAIKSDGSVVAWGRNYTPGVGSFALPDGLNGVIALAVGEGHNLGLRADGTVVEWGDGASQTTVVDGLNGVVAVAEGRSHSLALKSDGTVVAWGANWNGQSTVPEELTGVVAIAAGEAYSLALKADGTVVSWGIDFNGGAEVPEGLAGVVAIAAEAFHSLALKSDGTVVSWGGGENWEADGVTGAVAIVAGRWHSLALRSDGTIATWGTQAPDQLTDVVAIAAGSFQSLALVTDAPALEIQASGENISLSWPLWAQDFTLQSTTNLGNQGSWTPMLSIPTIKESRYQTTIPSSDPAKFYRLRK